MKHAGPHVLAKLEPLLKRIRVLPGFKEKGRGVFYRGPKAFLHFHEDPAGIFADVRLGDDWERAEVTTGSQRGRLARRLNASLGRLLGVALLAFLAIPAWSGLADPVILKGREFFAHWQREDYAAMYALLNQDARNHSPFEEFKKAWRLPPVEILKESVEDRPPWKIYVAVYRDAESVLKQKLAFDGNLQVAGARLMLDESNTPYPSPYENTVAPYRFRFPFAVETGEWTLTGEHHVVARSQRFAYDMRIFKDGSSWSGDEFRNESYYAYGQEVLSPASGIVVEAHDGEPENIPHREPVHQGENYVILKVDEKLYLYV